MISSRRILIVLLASLGPILIAGFSGNRTPNRAPDHQVKKVILTLHFINRGKPLLPEKIWYDVFSPGDRDKRIARGLDGRNTRVEPGSYDLGVFFRIGDYDGEKWFPDYAVFENTVDTLDLDSDIPDEAYQKQLLTEVNRNRPDYVANLMGLLDKPDPLALIAAASKAKIEVVRTLLENGADPNASTSIMDDEKFRLTPLGSAVNKGRLDVVDLLLRAGADVNADHMMRPLTAWAAENGHAEVLARLIAAGADPGGENPLGWTSLHMVAMSGELETARTLVQSGVAIDARDESGQTPLMFAAERRHKDVVDLLLEAGADPNASSSSGYTPLMAAAKGGNGDITRRLLESGAEPDARNAGGSSAATFGNGVDDVMDVLIEHSPKLQANRAVPKMKDGGSYPPGSRLSAPCEHSGAPGPELSCGAGGTEVTVFTSVRSSVPVGTIAPPECEPVVLDTEASYTLRTTRSISEWSTKSCYTLGTTTGAKKTLIYLKRKNSKKTEISKVTVEKGAEIAKDDPCEKPGIEIMAPDTVDVTYDDGLVSGVVYSVQVRVDPSGCDDSDVQWDIDPVGEIKPEIEPTSGGVTIRYRGLPTDNSDFGPKTLVARLGSSEDRKTVRIFFRPAFKNHGGEGRGTTPNWYYYWSQTSASTDQPITYTPELKTCSGPRPQARYVFADDVIYMTDRLFGSRCAIRTGEKKGSSGIDCFGELARHEGQHRKELRYWWPVEKNGIEFNPPGCKIAADILSGANLLKKLVGVDSDGDFVPDYIEDALRTTRGCDKNNGRSCSGRPTNKDVGDIEMNAYNVGWKWARKSADSEDWSYCGRQWKNKSECKYPGW